MSRLTNPSKILLPKSWSTPCGKNTQPNRNSRQRHNLRLIGKWGFDRSTNHVRDCAERRRVRRRRRSALMERITADILRENRLRATSIGKSYNLL